MAMLAAALGKDRGSERTAGDRDINGYGGAPTMTPGEDANGNPIMLPNPNQDAGGGSPWTWLKGAMKGLF